MMHKCHLYIDTRKTCLQHLGSSANMLCAGNSGPDFFLATEIILRVNAKKGMLDG